MQIKLGVLYSETMEVTSEKKKKNAFPLPPATFLDFLGRLQKSHSISQFSLGIPAGDWGAWALCLRKPRGAKLWTGSEGNNT